MFHVWEQSIFCMDARLFGVNKNEVEHVHI